MKSLILAAAVILPIGTGTALADSGESYEWAYAPASRSTVIQPRQTPATMKAADVVTKNNLADNRSAPTFLFHGNG